MTTTTMTRRHSMTTRVLHGYGYLWGMGTGLVLQYPYPYPCAEFQSKRSASQGSGQQLSSHQHLLFSADRYEVELHLVDLQPEGGSYGLIAVEPSLAPNIGALLPRHWKPYVLPKQPASYLPVPKPAIEHVKNLLETVRFDPVVSSLVNGILLNQRRHQMAHG
jgi:hypothetical protein